MGGGLSGILIYFLYSSKHTPTLVCLPPAVHLVEDVRKVLGQL